MEKIKAIDGVRLAVWSEIVDRSENKMSVPSYIIDSIVSFQNDNLMIDIIWIVIVNFV